jgi:quinol monooxygenase YgiN
MYVTRQEVEIQGLHIDEFETRTAQLTEAMQKLSGFEARRVLRSQGHPTRYTILGYWQSFDTADAAFRGEAMKSWFEQNPQPSWATSLRSPEAYEQVHEIVAAGAQGTTPGHINLVDWTLNPGPGNGPAFEASRKEIFTVHQQQSQGFLRHRLLRFLGGGGRYLVVNAWTSQEAALAAFQSPASQAIIQKYPAGTFASAPTVINTYRPMRVPVTA